MRKMWELFAETEDRYVTSLGPRPIAFFPTFDQSLCDKRNSSSAKELRVDVEQQQVAWKDCCMEYWCKKARNYMGRWTGRGDMTDLFLETALNYNQQIHDQSISAFPTREKYFPVKQR